MSPDLETKLIENYPEIFPDTGGASLLEAGWGLSVGDGWYDILDVLCGQLVAPLRSAENHLRYLDSHMDKSAGAHKITPEDIKKEEENITRLRAGIPHAVQVKEKFGGLRFYIGGGATEEQYAFISFAEEMSYRVCELCGGRAQPYPLGWVRTLCEHHAVEIHGQKAVDYLESKRKSSQ